MMERSHLKKRKYTLSDVHYSSHQNGTNHARTYSSPIHHSPRRFYSSEKSRGSSRGNSSPDMCNGDSATLPFYEHSPKYERTNKGKLHRQDTQPYWSDNPNHELNDVSRYSPNSHLPNSCEHRYGNRKTKEPYWVDTVGRKTNYSSPKLIHVSEKRPTRQTKEPYWMESFEHYEVQSHEENSKPVEDFAPPPMVHRELPTPAPQYDRSLSYRFPNQDPQYLKKRFLSLKRKLKDTATVTTTDAKTSQSESSDNPSCEKKECKKEENMQGNKPLSLGVHEKKGTSGQDEDSGLIKVTEIGPIDQTSPENPDQSLIPEVKNCKDNVIKVKIRESSTSDAKDNNVDTESEAESEVFDDIFFQTISKELEHDVYLSEEEKSLKDKPTQAKDNAQADNCMNTGLDCDLSRSEGSISPTFDSTLLRYLDDNIRSRITVDNSIKRSSVSETNQVIVNAKEKEDFNEKSESVIQLSQEDPKNSRQTCDTLTSDSDSNEKDYSEVKSKVDGNRKLCYGRIENENSQECVDDMNDTTTKVSQSPYQQINNIIENEDNSRPAAKTQSAVNEDKNNSGAPFTTSEISERVEKSPEAFLEFDCDSASSIVQECSNIKVSFDVVIDEVPLSLRQGISETSETPKQNNLTVEKIDKSLEEKPREEKPLSTKSSCETANSSGTCTASFDETSSREQSQDSEMKNDKFNETVMKNDKAEVVATVQDHINVDEGIRLIREKCKSSISVRHFKSALNKSTEIKEKTTTNEVSKASVSKDGGQYSRQIRSDSNSSSSDTKKNPVEDNSCIKESEGAFVPLCEDLLLSVKKELHRKEGETHQHDDSCCTENTSEDVALSSYSTKSASSEPAEDSNVYNILHSVVLASKMTREHVLNDIAMSSARDFPSDNDSVPITMAIELVERNVKDLKNCQGLVKSSIQSSTNACQSEVEVSSIDSTQGSLPDDKNTSGNKGDFHKDLIAKMPLVLEKDVGSLEKVILLPKISTEPLSKEQEKKNVESQVDTMTSDVKETLMLENSTKLEDLFAPHIQAKHQTERDLVSTCDSKKMEIDDLNLSTLCKTTSMEDYTPPVAEDVEKNEDCSTPRDVDTSAVEDKTPEAEKSPENIQAVDSKNLKSNTVDAGHSNAHHGRVWSIEGETPQERKEVNKSDVNSGDYRSDGDDQVSQSDGDDQVSKSDGDDQVSKSDGDDQVSKSDGDDQVSKSDGDDQVSKSDGDDPISKSDGDDLISKSDRDDQVSKSDGDNLISKSDGDDQVSKSDEDDQVSKSDGDDLISKSSGDDLISKSDEDDQVSKSDGDDLISKSSGDDLISKSDEDDQVSKSSGDDLISKSDGDDQVSKSDGDDQVAKSDGNDQVSKSSEDDQVSKSDADDWVSKSDGNDQVSKSDGNNQVWKSDRDDQVSKSDVDDQVSRRSGEETVLLQGQKKSCLADHTIHRDKNVCTVEDAIAVEMDIFVLDERKHNENLTSSKEREAKNGRLIGNKSKDLLLYNERKLAKNVQKDVELEKTTAALYKFLESNPNNFLSGTLKDIKRQDSPSSSPVVRSPSQDSIMTDTEDAYVDTLLLEAGQLSDVDTSSHGSSDVEMEDDTKKGRDLTDTSQESDLVIKSNEIGTTGNHELNKNLFSVGNSSLKEKQSTLGICIDSQRVPRKIFHEERKKFGENTKDVLRNINKPSMNTTELFEDSKDLPENCKAGGSENNVFHCKSITVFPKNTKEVTRNDKDVPLNNQEFFFNNKDVSKNTITPRKKGRPFKRSRTQKGEIQIDVSAGILKRRSPRQKKQVHDKNLSSRQIPYYRDKTKTFNAQFLKDSIEYKGDVKVINREFLEIGEEQLIDIMEIDYDVHDFHLELDASEEESPKKLCNLPTGSSSEKIVSKNSFDYSLTEQTNDALGLDIKPSEEVGINSKLTDNPSTHVKNMVNECFATKLISASCPSDSLSRRTIPLASCKAINTKNLLAASTRPSCSSARDKCVSKTSSLNGCLGTRGKRRRRRKFSQKESPESITTPLCAHSNETTAKVPFESSKNDCRTTELEVCIGTSDSIGGDKSSRENVNSSETMSIFTSVQSHTSCKVDPRTERSDENRSIFSFVNMCSSNSSSSPASSLYMEDISSQCSTESLKITLIGETNPSTGEMNWVTDPQKPTELKKEVSTSYGLRPSKTRKMKNPSPIPTGPNAKKRRMTITDLRSGAQNPQKLHDLAKRPLEEYIRSVEKVFRSSDKNPKKGMLSIAMNDHISKTTLPNQEGDYLKLGDTDVMYEIVKKAFDESKLKRSRPSPRSLYFAAKQGNALQVLVLAAGCNVNATIPQEKHKTAMHAASAAGHVNVLRLLCMVGGNLSCLDTNLQTPLFDAVENQRTEVVKFLISRDVNLNLKDCQGMTVLHVAAQKSNLEIINLLMETRRLSVNEQDNGGWTALMWTAEGMRKDVARCLLKWGADVNILDTEQNTCLHWAALAGDTEIMDLLLGSNVHIDARNMFGATALHISARERKLPNIKTLEKYRPNVEIKNAEGKTAIELVPANSKCYFQLKRIEMLMNLAKSTLKERLVSRDISRGQEKRPIPCVNEVDQEDLPRDFVYVSKNLENQSQGFDRSMTSCNCTDGCVNDKLCECAQLSTRKRFWYDETGRINSEIFEEDRPLVYECNMKCQCWSNCHQRVVQHGITAGLQLYKTEDKGFAVRTQAFISKGTFVCEYVGEILTDNEADRRKDDCYLFDLDVKGQSTLFCLDAKFYGNITRFINHSCDPNILPVRVFTDHQVKSCPRIAFFAARDIKPYEEVCSNYGEKFWTVKKSEFHCVCNTSKCRYGPGKKQ